MSSNELQSNVLRDLGSYGNIITEAQLLSRRDKVFNHRTGSFQTTICERTICGCKGCEGCVEGMKPKSNCPRS